MKSRDGHGYKANTQRPDGLNCMAGTSEPVRNFGITDVWEGFLNSQYPSETAP